MYFPIINLAYYNNRWYQYTVPLCLPDCCIVLLLIYMRESEYIYFICNTSYGMDCTHYKLSMIQLLPDVHEMCTNFYLSSMINILVDFLYYLQQALSYYHVYICNILFDIIQVRVSQWHTLSQFMGEDILAVCWRTIGCACFVNTF